MSFRYHHAISSLNGVSSDISGYGRSTTDTIITSVEQNRLRMRGNYTAFTSKGSVESTDDT